jgi:hypothetical protein
MGLLAVVVSLAPRISEELESLILHQNLMRMKLRPTDVATSLPS